jgi:HEAT repeat protein
VDATARAATLATASAWPALAEIAGADPEARVRAVALARLVSGGPRDVALAAWRQAARDGDARVRLRAAQLAPRLGRAIPTRALVVLLADADAWVADAAAYAIGEHPRPGARAVSALVESASGHADPLVREAAVAALGAIGDPATLPTILRACDDKPAIRRRAILALAAFEGPEVELRLQRALEDRDWQVRQAAEDLLRATP